MKKFFLAGALAALGAPIVASAACPAGVTPDNYLVKQKVAFRINATRPGVPPLLVSAAVGTVLGLPNGLLSVIISQNAGGNITREENATGRWMVNADCSGGMVWIMWGGHYYVINFVISSTGVITIAPNPPGGKSAYDELGDNLTGAFLFNPPMVCPPNAINPLDVLNGMTYAFSGTADFAQTDGTPGFGPIMPAYGGGTMPFPLSTFTALDTGGYSGTLMINNRAIGVFKMPPLLTTSLTYNPNYTEYGRYTINPDCSGGELLFMSGSFPRQYEFVFATIDFKTIWYISDVSGSAPYNGTAIKQ